jgi:predicted ABC-type transport system involved in lysophospholipase L1 biosynthesis ATPase subunit
MGDLVLVLDGVGKSFRRGRRRWRVLEDVSLTVALGEVVGVLGARGEGKTTLLRVAAGIEPVDAGSVWFEGRDVTCCSVDERADLLGHPIAWVHREGMGDLRVLEYVGLSFGGSGLGQRDLEDRAMAALERVGVSGVEGHRWEELSNWERVLVAFARGYVASPRLMVVDDLLDGLGHGGTREAGELLLSLARELGCGVLVAASDLDALLVADRVLAFEGATLTVMSGGSSVSDLDHKRRHAGR